MTVGTWVPAVRHCPTLELCSSTFHLILLELTQDETREYVEKESNPTNNFSPLTLASANATLSAVAGAAAFNFNGGFGGAPL